MRKRKTDNTTIRMLKSLSWDVIENTIDDHEPKTDKKVSLEIAENMVVTRFESGSYTARWTIEIAGIAQWKEGFLRLDFAQPACFEMKGRMLREIIDHPAFDEVLIKDVNWTPHANRRSGAVFSLERSSSILSGEGWAVDPSMGVPARIDPRFASAGRLKAAPVFIGILEHGGASPTMLQTAYEHSAMPAYPDKITEWLHFDQDRMPLELMNMSARIAHGVMGVRNLAIGAVKGETILFDAYADHSVITIPFTDALPAAVLVGLAGRDLASAIRGWEYGTGSLISEAEVRDGKLTLRIEEDPVPLPDDREAIDFGHRTHEGPLVFTDGPRFQDLKELVRRTHSLPAPEPAEDWSQHLEVSAITIGSRKGRTVALRMRQKGLKKRFADRYGFAVVGDGWWICPLDRFRYEEWRSIARTTLTIRAGDTILLDQQRERYYGLQRKTEKATTL